MKLFRKIAKSSHLSKEDKLFYNEIKNILSFPPLNIEIYKRAFVHRSMKATDKEGNPKNYERLEFLGDAMLDAVIASYLFKKVPAGDEGYLTQMRSKIVSREHLNELGKDLDLIRFIQSNVASDKFGENVNGNIFEAFIGAIYLDRGYEFCKRFIYNKIIEPYVDIERLEGKITSYKSVIIEWCQKKKKQFKYEVYEDTGKDVIKHFSVKLYVNKKMVSKGRSTSKKKAEEIASKRAYYTFQKEIDNN